MNKNRNFISFLKKALKKDLLFACFSYPGSKKLHFLSQRSSIILSSSDVDVESATGFVFQPFDRKSEGIWIQGDIYFNDESDYSSELDSLLYNRHFQSQITPPLNKKDYILTVNSLIQSIKNNEADKVVFSRSQSVEISRNEIADPFMKLNNDHFDAFVFLVNLPGKITWIGATPEVLISEHKGAAESMALAATRSASDDDNNWSDKEIEEQNYVAGYIENVLSEKNITYQKSELKEKILNSGVKHLCQNFKFELPKNVSVWNIVYNLHPTPAVCGIPVKNSMKLIEKTENYQREYYTGFLGPVNLADRTDLFVNLRSAQITENKACLYVGGGITGQSTAESEWDETKLKSATILNALKTDIN